MLAERASLLSYHYSPEQPISYDDSLQTFHPEEYADLLQTLPDVRDLTRRQEKVTKKPKDKIVAMDLSDELNNIRELKKQGRNPEEYWNFFRDQAEYFGNETYGKVKVANYVHELAQENGHLRLWIDSLGKTARESYREGYEMAEEGWYKERCRKEAESVADWEHLLQLHLGNRVIVDISPAPFEVPQELFKGSNFGEHSFLRLHQMVKDDEGAPVVFSRAFRVYLPPSQLARMYQVLTDDNIKPEELLGNYGLASEKLGVTNITDEEVPVQIQSLIKKMEENTPEDQRIQPLNDVDFASVQEMKEHYATLEPHLRRIFEDITRDRLSGESKSQFISRIVKQFQTWEMMLKGKVKGEWKQLEKQWQETFAGDSRSYSDSQAMLYYMTNFYANQEYRPEANGCGGGSGASNNGGFLDQSSSIFTTTSPISSGMMNYGGLSTTTSSESQDVCVTCPYCKNKEGNKKLKGKYICGNKSCKSNKK